MKKKQKITLIILSAIICLSACFFCLKPSQKVYAVNSNYSYQYNYYTTLTIPDTSSEEIYNGLTYQNKTEAKANIDAINTLVATSEAELTPEEILALGNKKEKIEAYVNTIDGKETAIKNDVISYFESVLAFTTEEKTIAKINELKDKYNDKFVSEIVMGFVNGSDKVLDVSSYSEEYSTLTTQKTMLSKAYSIVNVEYIKLTYLLKKNEIETEIGKLKPIPKTVNEDQDALEKLQKTINNYYEEVKNDIEAAGFNKADFESDFARYAWQVQVRLNQITSKVNTKIIWIITGIILSIAFAWLGIKVAIHYIIKGRKMRGEAKSTKK